MFIKRFYAAVLGLLAGLMMNAQAHAAIDVSNVLTEINNTLGPIGQIGAAVLIVIVSIAAFRWVRRAI